MSPYKEVSLAGLNCLIAGNASSQDTIILLHGYGADAFDLLPMHEADPEKRWIFPFGPLKIDFGSFFGHAWFPLDVAKIMEILGRGEAPTHKIVDKMHLEAARKKISALIAACGAPPSRIILGGFSQGAILSTDVALHEAEHLAGLAILSGSLVTPPDWQAAAESKKGLRYIQTHGKDDMVLPFALAKPVHDLLQKAGCKGTFTPFGGAHEIGAGYSELKKLISEAF